MLAEIEVRFADGPATVALNPNQLDLFGWVPAMRGEEVHRVRAADGRIYEGDWETIVGAMRDAGDPTATLTEYMRHEARRLQDLTGILISTDDPQSFIEESARVGALEIER